MLPEVLVYTLPVAGAASLAVSIMYVRLLRARYDPQACMRSLAEIERRLAGEIKRLAEEASERERFWLQRVRKLCGLSEDAARLLDALEKGQVQLICSDGGPALLAAGRVICLREGGAREMAKRAKVELPDLGEDEE